MAQGNGNSTQGWALKSFGIAMNTLWDTSKGPMKSINVPSETCPPFTKLAKFKIQLFYLPRPIAR